MSTDPKWTKDLHRGTTVLSKFNTGFHRSRKYCSLLLDEGVFSFETVIQIQFRLETSLKDKFYLYFCR